MMTANPPVYVSIILDPFIRLEWMNEALHTQLVAEGIQIEGDSCNHQCVRFDTSAPSHMKNSDLINHLLMLNQQGVVFAEDYTQLYSPAEFMRALHAEGILRVPFKSIAFGVKQQGDWQIREHLPNKASHGTALSSRP